MPSLKLILGARVHEIHKSRDITQEFLAEQLGVTPRYLVGIERGERNLSLDSIDALAARLGVDAQS